MKVALLSNINVDYVIQLLNKKYSMVSGVGYGNVWGQLLDSNSYLNKENPDVIVFLPDIEELLDGHYNINECSGIIDEWFRNFDIIVKSGKDYFIPGILFRSRVITDNDSLSEDKICQYWLEKLEQRLVSCINVHYLNLTSNIISVGKATVFSSKMWYMGKIPYSNKGTKIVVNTLDYALQLFNRTAKKVLVLDLDNTLWGGVLGECGVEGIELSDEHIGAIYKRVQQQIRAIKENGVLLAISSKNNEEDVQEVWDKHPHMVLRREDFSSVKINWEDKAVNILAIAKEMNLGTDSFVFLDDMAFERENICTRLPAVTVPDFPDKIERYPEYINQIYETYFKKIRLSAEDKVKTKQYAENAMREEAAKGLTYESFLISLNLKIKRVELDDANLDRIAQLHGKTNQFNLTTIRYNRQDIDKLLHDGYQIYAYNVQDKFGDYGLVAVAIVDCKNTEIKSFLMSCRVMGKLIENYVIDQIEADMKNVEGSKTLRARYIPTAKNTPVERLFEDLGYSVTNNENGTKEYEIELDDRPERKYFVNVD